MYSAEICQSLITTFPDVTLPPALPRYLRDPAAQVVVPAKNLVAVSHYLRDNEAMAFDLPNQMTAIDYIKENAFELVYHLYSTKKKQAIVLKARIDRATPEIDSLTPIWPGFDWQEREVYDLMGIRFVGHPNLKRILMWEGFPGYPLRKDYVHVTDRFDSGLEVGTPGLDAKGLPAKPAGARPGPAKPAGSPVAQKPAGETEDKPAAPPPPVSEKPAAPPSTEKTAGEAAGKPATPPPPMEPPATGGSRGA